MASYSAGWARRVYFDFVSSTYYTARATEILLDTYKLSEEDVIEWIQKDQTRWKRFRGAAKVIRKGAATQKKYTKKSVRSVVEAYLGSRTDSTTVCDIDKPRSRYRRVERRPIPGRGKASKANGRYKALQRRLIELIGCDIGEMNGTEECDGEQRELFPLQDLCRNTRCVLRVRSEEEVLDSDGYQPPNDYKLGKSSRRIRKYKWYAEAVRLSNVLRLPCGKRVPEG